MYFLTFVLTPSGVMIESLICKLKLNVSAVFFAFSIEMVFEFFMKVENSSISVFNKLNIFSRNKKLYFLPLCSGNINVKPPSIFLFFIFTISYPIGLSFSKSIKQWFLERLISTTSLKNDS